MITPAEQVAEIGRHFVSSHNLGQNIINPHEAAVSELAKKIYLTPNDFSEELEITANKMMAHIKSSKNMKAPGFDSILNLELKHTSAPFVEHLSLIFNQCLRLSYFPSSWNFAKVIRIWKPGKDPSSTKSYRPISLFSGLSKLFEKSIHHRLLESADNLNIFLEKQFGF